MPHSSPRCPHVPSAALTAAAAVVVAVVVTVLTACGPVDQDDVTPERFVDPPEVSAAAVERYGERAEQAYEQTAELLLEQAYVLPLIDPEYGTPTAAELSEGIVGAMTPEAAEEWVALVDRDLAGDTVARETVQLLRFHSWDAPGSELASEDDPVRFQTVTEGEVDLATVADVPGGPGADPPLDVSLVHRVSTRLTEGRVPYEVVHTKPLTFTLVPDPDDRQRWLIATFDGLMQVEVQGVEATGG